MRKSILFAILFIIPFLVSSLECAEEKNVASAKQRLEKLSSNIQTNKKQIQIKQKEKKTAQARLWAYSRKLRVLKLQLKQTKKKLLTTKTKTTKLKTKIGDLETKQVQTLDILKNRFVSIYKNKNAGFLEYFFSSEGLLSPSDTEIFLKKILMSDIQFIKKIKLQSETLQQEKKELSKQSKNIIALKYVMKEKERLIYKKKRRKARLVRTLSKQISAIVRKNKELEKNSNEITRFIIETRKGKKGYFGTGRFIKPVSGWISSLFGTRIHPILKKKLRHFGIDFAAPKGYKIRASDSGIVLLSGRKHAYKGYGKVTIIDHGWNKKIKKRFSSVYAHQSRILVKKGAFVKQGDEIGWVGSTGFSTGPHLHFEIRVDGVPVNPLKYIKKR